MSKQRGIVEQVARGEVVGAINDDVIVSDDACNVGFVQALDIRNNFDIGVERLDGFTR